MTFGVFMPNTTQQIITNGLYVVKYSPIINHALSGAMFFWVYVNNHHKTCSNGYITITRLITNNGVMGYISTIVFQWLLITKPGEEPKKGVVLRIIQMAGEIRERQEFNLNIPLCVGHGYELQLVTSMGFNTFYKLVFVSTYNW